VAQVLTDLSRRTDIVGRLGGDEFAMLLPSTDRNGAEWVIGKTRQSLRAAFQASRSVVTCSIGAVTFPHPPPQADEVIRAADSVMYQVKSQGKNAIAFVVFDSSEAGLQRS